MLIRSTLVAALLLLAPIGAHGAASPEEVHATMAKAVESEAKAQAKYTEWTDSKSDIAGQIRDMKAMDDWLEYQNKKYAKYIDRQKTVIAELERRKEEAKIIRMQLEPFLETLVDTLDEFVASDMPFLPEERQQRIAFLRSSLDDYRLSLSEKLRRVFEALLVETEYGRNVAATTRDIELETGTTQVRVFRLGRTALFYQATDGSAAGVWDRATNSWKPLDQEFSRTLRRARDMAERKRAVELLELPIGAAR